ncbi:MAG: hypothetical protein KAS32_21195 [Candidatus Peribacteraceae bacterium]|nr:hypothetical protein [Candidatus Peribacteraceae bacterium]
MSATFVDISAAIGARLALITGAGQPLVNVYDYFNAKIENYPAATYQANGYVGSTLTTTDNRRTFNFTVNIVQEFENRTLDQAVAGLYEAVDAAVKILEADATLDGNVDFFETTVGAMFMDESSEGAIIYMQIEIRAVAEVNISS